MSRVSVDGTDGFATPLRGWGAYVRRLVEHLPPELVHIHRHRGRLPEVLWKQLGFPAQVQRASSAALHAPNCFLPLVRPCPGVVTVHDLAFEAFPEDFSAKTGAKYRVFTPRAVRSAERIICVSAATADDVVVRYGADPDRIRVIHNGPSLPLGDAPVPPGDPYLLAVGDLRGKKNLPRLVEAWRRLGTGHRLVLAGLGDPVALGLGADVEVTGFVDDATLDALMRGADVLVHPSLYEGFGLVLVEAMARGTPVACSATTALPETAGGAAVLFDPLDVDAIAAGITEALARRDELREAGLRRALDFSWARAAEQTAAVYAELVG